MSMIMVALPAGEIPVDGKQVSFVAPCNSLAAEGIQIDGEVYSVVDAIGNTITGKGRVWDTGAIVSVVIDVTNKKAYVQNSAKSIPVNIDATLLAASWTGDNAPYTQAITVAGVLADSAGFVGVAESATDEQFQAAVSATLRKASQSEGSLTIKAYGKKPTVDIPITIVLN